MKKRPTKKLLDQHIVLAMIDVANKIRDYNRAKKYWNAYHCFEVIETDGNRACSRYCENLFCSVYNGNRKAKLIRQYRPNIELY